MTLFPISFHTTKNYHELKNYFELEKPLEEVR
jgi:hypothetical protein